MLNVKQSYIIAKQKVKDLKLISILDFGENFGFLFGASTNDIVLGSSYILVNKKNKELSFLPTTPDNVKKINSAKKLPLTSIL